MFNAFAWDASRDAARDASRDAARKTHRPGVSPGPPPAVCTSKKCVDSPPWARSGGVCSGVQNIMQNVRGFSPIPMVALARGFNHGEQGELRCIFLPPEAVPARGRVCGVGGPCQRQGLWGGRCPSRFTECYTYRWAGTGWPGTGWAGAGWAGTGACPYRLTPSPCFASNVGAAPRGRPQRCAAKRCVTAQR